MELGRAEEEFRVTGVTDSPDCSQGHFEDEGVTPADVLLQLTTAWRSERCAPVLLPHRFVLLCCLCNGACVFLLGEGAYLEVPKFVSGNSRVGVQLNRS